MTNPHPNLGTPPKLVSGGLRIVALGGIAEIGRNMTVYESKGKLLVVDCGVLFPEDNQPGIDLILPDFSYIRDRLDDVIAIVLTHGHEDHIGAVPYLLREKEIFLYTDHHLPWRSLQPSSKNIESPPLLVKYVKV